MAHKKKTKEDKNLIYIEKRNENESSLTIALKVLSMIENDFNLTIAELTTILKCERQWITKYVQDNVKHIFLNDKYRAFLMEVDRKHSITEEKLYLKDYYYFSRTDFFKWLKNNTVATKQTQRIDINIYSDNVLDFKKITDEYREVLKEAKTSILVGMANIVYEENIRKTLSPAGQKIFDKRLGVVNRKGTSEVVLRKFELPETFVSIKELKSSYGKSLEIVYRDLFKCGAIKYTIAGSLVRYDEHFSLESFKKSHYPYTITIPYEYYIKKVKRIKNKRRGK